MGSKGVNALDPLVPGLAQKLQTGLAHRHFFISIIHDEAGAERLNSGGRPGPGRESPGRKIILRKAESLHCFSGEGRIRCLGRGVQEA